MRTFQNRKASSKVLKILEQRFQEGEKLTVEGIISEYFKSPSNNPYMYLLARKKVKAWIEIIKRRLRAKGIHGFGSVNGDGEFGIANTPDEVNWQTNHLAYKMVKGIITNRTNAVNYAIQQGLILPEKLTKENQLLPKIINGKEENGQ